MEPYRVHKAVFMAVGFGSRLAPVTLNTPKSLIRVIGQCIIDTAIDVLWNIGITDITIVHGYLGEQFDQLLYKYPMLKFVDNPLFNEANNIASAVVAKNCFEGAYVLDADLIVKNQDLFRKYEYESNLLGVPVKRIDDWCVTTDKYGYVDSLAMGGLNGYREVGIFYCSQEDGKKLVQDLVEVYKAPGGKEHYWEQVSLHYEKDNYKFAVHSCAAEAFVEIDTFNELKEIDKAYGL